MRTIQRHFLSAALLFAVIAVITPSVVLASKGFYTVDKTVRSGMLVSLTKNTNVVEAATDKNMASLVGVIGTSQTDYGVEPDQVSVQTDGVVNTLVSTVAGDIKVGDHISPSIVVGFGAKSDGNSWIVGTAQASLGADTKAAVKTTVIDTQGNKHEVYVATIPVLVKVMQENVDSQATGEQSSFLPNKIQTFADSLAGKKASQVAVILGFFILLAGIIISGVIVNAAVKNGIVSTARQPLAKQAVMRRMTQSITIAVVILGVAVMGSLVIVRIL